MLLLTKSLTISSNTLSHHHYVNRSYIKSSIIKSSNSIIRSLSLKGGNIDSISNDHKVHYHHH